MTEIMTFAQMMTAFENAIAKEEYAAFARVVQNEKGEWEFAHPGEWVSYDIKQSKFHPEDENMIHYRRYLPNFKKGHTELNFGVSDITSTWVEYTPAK